MTYACSIIPLLVLLAVLKFTDSFTLVTWKHILYSMVAGTAVCLLSLLLSLLFERIGVAFYSPLIEELLKFCVLLWLVSKSKIVFIEQALCYGAAIGAGFAAAENILYIQSFEGMTVGTALFRGLGTAVMHLVCPMISASFLAGAADLKDKGNIKWARTMGMGLAGLLIAVGVHASFNMQLLPLSIQLLVTIIVFTLVVFALYSYNEKRISKWLDQSINVDISLLKAIRSGHLSQTPQGEYIMMVKSQFDPETVADMLCYISLYLELIIGEKSRLMLREAGLETPRTAEQAREHEAAMAEFRELRRRIGKTGEAILRPIVRISRSDGLYLLTGKKS